LQLTQCRAALRRCPRWT